MLSFLIPNPPVPAVPNDVVRASNTGILPMSNSRTSSIVIPKYIRYRSRAVCRTFGTSLPTEGPGLSARMRLIWEPPLSGIIARRNTRTPIPPIQCVKLRQNMLQ